MSERKLERLPLDKTDLKPFKGEYNFGDKVKVRVPYVTKIVGWTPGATHKDGGYTPRYIVEIDGGLYSFEEGELSKA